MNFQIKEYLKTSGIGAVVALGFSVVSAVFKTVILIRMNAQHCIPETSLYEFYDINYQLCRLGIFTLLVPILLLLINVLSTMLTPNINIPEWLSKILYYILMAIVVIIAGVGIALFIWVVFIKNPC